MSRSLNKVMLIGNVGAEPELRTTPGGTRLAKVSLATNRQYTDRSGQKQDKTEWHRLTFWDKLAEVVEKYVHKGDRLYIEGRIEYSQTQDDQGNVRYFTDIIALEMVMLGSGSGGGRSGGGGGGGEWSREPAGAPTPGPFEPEDDLPF